LLPYLVRRLLENGANTSFGNRVVDEDVPIRDLVADPCETVREFSSIAHPRIPLPGGLYGEQRKNSMGGNLANDDELKPLAAAVRELGADPGAAVREAPPPAHPRMPLPVGLYGEQRKNCMGVNLANDDELKALAAAVNAGHGPWTAAPLVPGAQTGEAERDVP